MSEYVPDSNPVTALKVPPHSIEAEQLVLGGLMLDDRAWFDLIEILAASDFYRTQHQIIFEAMNDLASDDNLLDAVTVAERLTSKGLLDKAGGISYLAELAESTLGASNVLAYGKIVRERSVMRQLIGAANQIAESAFTPEGRDTDTLLELAEQAVFQIAENRLKDSGPEKVAPLLTKAVEKVEFLRQTKGALTGQASGFVDLDRLTTGWQKSDLVIVAARPSMGKTSLATNIAFNAAQKLQDSGKKSSIAFFSLEMSSEQLSTRIISEQARISSNDIRRGRISDDQFDKFLETSKNISELPLYIDETPAITIAALSNRARRIKRLFGLDMIVVDYIQLMRGTTFNKDGRVQEISQITQGLKAIAKELSVPVVALSQLSRQVEQRDDNKPLLSDLRESGSIEQDADVVMFVYREAYYLQRKEPRAATVEHAEWQAKMNEVAHLAQLIIGKQRHGPIGNVTLEFEERFTKFKDTQTN